MASVKFELSIWMIYCIRTSQSAKALTDPTGAMKMNGFLGRSSSIPKFSTSQGSIVNKKLSLMSPAGDTRL